MNSIHVNKIFNLDENFKFTNCLVCKNELSPFSITREELDNLDWETVEMMVDMELVKLNEIGIDKHLIYLCKYCLDGKKSC